MKVNSYRDLIVWQKSKVRREVPERIIDILL